MRGVPLTDRSQLPAERPAERIRGSAVVLGGGVLVDAHGHRHGKINPGKVFDLTIDLDQIAGAYAAMDERLQSRRW